PKTVPPPPGQQHSKTATLPSESVVAPAGLAASSGTANRWSNDAIGTSSSGPRPPCRRTKSKLAGLSSVRAGRRTCPGLGQKLVDMGPKRPAGSLVVFQQRLERRLIADAG